MAAIPCNFAHAANTPVKRHSRCCASQPSARRGWRSISCCASQPSAATSICDFTENIVVFSVCVSAYSCHGMRRTKWLAHSLQESGKACKGRRCAFSLGLSFCFRASVASLHFCSTSIHAVTDPGSSTQLSPLPWNFLALLQGIVGTGILSVVSFLQFLLDAGMPSGSFCRPCSHRPSISVAITICSVL